MNRVSTRQSLVCLYCLNGHSAEHEAHLPFIVFLPFSPHEHDPLPFRKKWMATTTIAKTTSNTMAVGRFMR